MQVLGAFRHPNLLPLLGFSSNDHHYLVYPLMIGGSLEDRYDYSVIVCSLGIVRR